MEISYVITNEIVWEMPSFVETLVTKLPKDSYQLENAESADGKILKNGIEVLYWYRTKFPYFFENHGEVMFHFEGTSWWGLTSPIEEVDPMTLRKVELNIIETNIGGLEARRNQILGVFEDYSEAMEIIKNSET